MKEFFKKSRLFFHYLNDMDKSVAASLFYAARDVRLDELRSRLAPGCRIAIIRAALPNEDLHATFIRYKHMDRNTTYCVLEDEDGKAFLYDLENLENVKVLDSPLNAQIQCLIET